MEKGIIDYYLMKTIKKLIEILKEKINNKETDGFEIGILINIILNKFEEELFLHYEEFLKLIGGNLDYLLSLSSNVDLFSLRNLFEDDKSISKINSKIKDNPTLYIKNLINRVYSCFVVPSDFTKEETKNYKLYLNFLYLLVIDNCNRECINFEDIAYIGKGSFCGVIKIGGRVLKIGSTRVTDRYHNNPYISYIYLRKCLKLSEDIDLFVEVTERVDSSSCISEEEIYQLFKKLKDIGISWGDVEFRNVGRLLRDNTYYDDSVLFCDEDLGLDCFIGEDRLKQGDVVILDNDMLFDGEIPYDELEKLDIWFNECSMQMKFEKRYIKEKTHIKAK